MLRLYFFAFIVSAGATFPTELVYQSPVGLWLENIAVRESSQLLLTSVLSPTLYTLDPRSENATLDEVYTFPNCTGLTGIAEYQPDVFAVVASTLNVTARRALPGSISIWRVAAATGAAEQISNGISNGTIDGLSSIPGNSDLVLAGESVGGIVYEINMRSGTTGMALQSASFFGIGKHAPADAIGINGLRARAEIDGRLNLYFTNSAQGTFGRVPIAVKSGHVVQDGAFEVLGTIQDGPPSSTHAFDDFALDRRGAAWANAAEDPEGSYAVFTEPTSAAFGRGEKYEQTLFVTTGGGQVVAVDT